ncbi:tetratricopeptide repeat protein [Agriterribacter humi]|jgi:tetratricopeptide (TPR) repeat protein|uniref:tetratricopeptide repeat protein n=1 Tax=Agriterribacter humi TaxID=1104781 RepID=UPI001264008B|nr:tetratricopeptide repeat protein [Agriterribacter humi]
MRIRRFNIPILLLAVFFCACNTSPDRTNTIAEPENPSVTIQKLQQAVKAKPDSAGLRYLLMDALLKNNRFKEALTQNDTMLAADSLNAGLWYRRGAIFLQSGDTVNGITALKKSVERAPMFAEPLLQLSAVYANQLKPEALAIADRIINLAEEPRVASQARFIKGLYYSNINNKAKAIEQFDECIKNDYTFLEAYIEKGLLLYDQQNYAEALKVFERAIQVSNTFAEAYYQSGRCQEALGNKAEATLYYQKTLGLDKDFAAAREALERLK